MKNIHRISLLSALFLTFITSLLKAQSEKQDTTESVDYAEEIIDFSTYKKSKKSMLNGSEANILIPEIDQIYTDPSFVKKAIPYENYKFFHKKKYSNKQGIINEKKVILPNIYNLENHTMKLPLMYVTLNANHGVFDLDKEEWVVPLKYKILFKFNENILIGVLMNGKTGLITERGEVVIDFNWDKIYKFNKSDNYVEVKEKYGRTFFIGVYSLLTKELIIPCEYLSLNSTERSDLFLAQNSNREYNFVDTRNQTQLKIWYTGLHQVRTMKNLYIAEKGNLFGIIDIEGKEIAKIDYLKIVPSFLGGNYFIAQNQKGKFGIIKPDGSTPLPFDYDNLGAYFSNSGNILAVKNKKQGIIRMDNGVFSELCSFDFDEMILEKKISIVKKKDKYGVLDNSGKEIIPINKEEIKVISLAAAHFKTEKIFLIVKEKNEYNIYNEIGTKISTAFNNIDKIVSFPEKEARSNLYKYFKIINANNRAGVLDLQGKEVIKPIFEDIEFEYKNLFCVKKAGKLGFYSTKNKELTLPCEFDQIIKTRNTFIGLKGKKYYQIKIGEKIEVIKL